MQINTNSMALFAYRSLISQQEHLGKAMERLSSGLRINNAADDVAGVAISDRMTARVRSLNQVHRNANDGISLLQTADSALSNIGDILQRIREIAVQSANDSYSGTDRGSMQGEVNQMLQEINRISIDTKFNGKTLIDGSGGMGTADADEQLVINGLRGSWLREPEDLIKTYYGLTGHGTSFEIILEYDAIGGQAASVTSYYSGGAIDRHELRIDMEDFTAPDSIGGLSADRIIAHEMVHGLMADNMDSTVLPNWLKEGASEFIHGADERVVGDLAGVGGNVATFVNAAGDGTWTADSLHYASAYIAVRFLHEQATGGMKGIMNELKNGASLDAAIAARTSYADASAFLADYSGAAGQGYLQGLIDGGYLTNEDTGAIGGADADGGLVRTATSVIPDTGGYTYDPLSGFDEVWPGGFDRLVTYNSFDLQVGENNGDRLAVSIGATTVTALGLSGIDVATDPNTVIDKVDLALTYLNEQRGGVGGALNRLGHLINVNAINIETTSDARSRTLD
ncbi:MAG: flagellinolysin, partial [Candidatus Competibacteraceae bacterium]|nr:flagellinolysin [Candidatus Competibacteraceae bacterium]